MKSRWKGGGSISENGSSVLPGPWDKNLGFILISFLSYLTSHLVADLGGCIFKVHPGSGQFAHLFYYPGQVAILSCLDWSISFLRGRLASTQSLFKSESHSLASAPEPPSGFPSLGGNVIVILAGSVYLAKPYLICVPPPHTPSDLTPCPRTPWAPALVCAPSTPSTQAPSAQALWDFSLHVPATLGCSSRRPSWLSALILLTFMQASFSQ